MLLAAGADLVADLRARDFHRGQILVIEHVGDGLPVARQLLAASPPGLNERPLGDENIQHAEVLEPRHERHEVDVAERAIVADEPRTTVGQGRIHQAEQLLERRDCKQHIGRLGSVLIGGTEARATAWVADIVEADVALLFGHVAQLVTEHRAETDFPRRLEDALVDLLAPQPHLRPFIGRGRHQRRRRERLIEVFADQGRFDDRPAVVHQGRHHALRIVLEVGWIVLLVLEQVDALRFERQPFLEQRDQDFLRADQLRPVKSSIDRHPVSIDRLHLAARRKPTRQ